jgi:membrane protein DedA with SNARE-associated domain
MGLEAAILGFLDHYGYVALFTLLALETAMILHFVPGELIVAVAAARLVHSPATLALVVADAAAGSTAGALALYAASRYGGRAFVLRHPKLFRVTPEKLDRMRALFQGAWGPALAFVCRLLPFVRAPVSVPAGLAPMDVAPFAAFSLGGNALFAVAIAWATWRAGARGLVDEARGWVVDHVVLLVVVTLVVAVAAAYFWSRRRALREHPRRAALDAWRHAALALLGCGLALVALAVAAPGFAADLVTAIAQDYGAWAAAHGLSDAVVALLAALELIALGLAALAIGRGVRALLRGRRA